MIAELQAHPAVQIDELVREPPATQAALDEIAEFLDPLPEGLPEYLAFANGLRLTWTVEGNENRRIGTLAIPPLQRVRKPENWWCAMDALEDIPAAYGGVDMSRAFPFDFVFWTRNDVDIAGLLPIDGRYDVFVSDDNVACVDASYLLSFSEYLQLVCRSYASFAARFALTGRTNPAAVRAADAVPAILQRSWALDDIIAFHSTRFTVEDVQRFFVGSPSG